VVAGLWQSVCESDDLDVPSRIVWLPLSWDDPACQKAIDKYMTTVRRRAVVPEQPGVYSPDQRSGKHRPGLQNGV
jgi:hypothetical protein